MKNSVSTNRLVTPIASTQGTLALDLDVSPGLPPAPRLTLVPQQPRGLDAFAARFAQAVVEVVGGDRGSHQLMAWTSPAVYADLCRRQTLLHRTTPPDQRARQLKPQVRSVRIFCPRSGVAEVSVHVRHGQRSRALAARLEKVHGQWRCTALELG